MTNRSVVCLFALSIVTVAACSSAEPDVGTVGQGLASSDAPMCDPSDVSIETTTTIELEPEPAPEPTPGEKCTWKGVKQTVASSCHVAWNWKKDDKGKMCRTTAFCQGESGTYKTCTDGYVSLTERKPCGKPKGDPPRCADDK